MYALRISKKAAKQLKTLPTEYQQRISRKIDQLAHTPRPRGVKKLSGKLDIYRIRQGPYRILFQVRG
ncbi:MAG: type II toxin-antitoxin system RelE/ParE family toxin [Deltaproteobacteria bacterium]|nr:type II toxin-antitoxin system RelE/ParE family toxin [Deltaproteobacteria bacterium]